MISNDGIVITTNDGGSISIINTGCNKLTQPSPDKLHKF